MASDLPVLPRRVVGALLAALCLLGFGLRTANLNWDDGQHLHPDERYWSFVTNEVAAPSGVRDYLDADASALNPYNYFDTWVYGTWPVALTKVTSTWLSNDGPVGRATTSTLDGLGVDLRTSAGPRFDNGYDANLIGRLISALFDTATIAVVFALARRLAGSSIAGLLAAALQTFAVLHIQYSHFYGSETLAAFFTTVVVLQSVRLVRRGPTTGSITAIGALAGVAVAAKLNSAPVLIAPLAALAVHHFVDWRASVDPSRRVAQVGSALSNVSLLGLSSVVAVKATLPYAFGRWWGLKLDQPFTDDLDYLQAVNDGSFNVAWTIQWIGRSRLFGPLATAFQWGLGPPLGLAVLVGIAVAIRRLRHKELVWAVPLAFLAVEIVTVALQFNGLIRYLLPAYPVAIALAGVGLARLVAYARRASVVPALRWAAAAAVTMAVAGTALWAVAFTNGVYGEQNPRLAATEWIAANVPAGSTVSHSVWDDSLPLPTDATVALGLRTVDLEPFASDATAKVETLVGSLDEVDYVIEASNRLYDSVTRFPARYPSTIRYYDALFEGELGFTEVARFANRPSLFGVSIDDSDAEETFTVYDHPTVIIWQKTTEWSPAKALSVIGPDRGDTSLDTEHASAGANALLLRPDDYRAQQEGGTYTDVFDRDGPTSTEPWLWWLAWLQVAGFAAVPWTTWLFARTPGGGYAFAKLTGFLAATVPLWFLIASGWVDHTRRAAWLSLALVVAIGAVVGWRRRSDLASDWRRHRRSWLAVEATFVVAFVGLVLLASANPDLWHPFVGGEKPMETAYFTAITRSTTLPAYDPWFAGGFINYYYVGFFLLSVPTKALAIAPEVALNLGLPTMVALAATTLFGVGQMLAPTFSVGTTRRPHLPIAPGFLAVGAVLLIGNLEGGLQWWRSRDAPFDWWAPSRVNDGLFDITEFPFWSLLFRDIHPHVLDMAMVALVIALSVAYVTTVRHRDGGGARAWLLAASLGIVTGIVRMVHTWDLPGVVLLAVGAVGVAHLGGPHSGTKWWPRLRSFGLATGVVAVTHLLLTGPYRASSEVFDGAIERAEETTRLGDFLSQFGLFIFVALGYAVVRARELGTSRLSQSGPVVAVMAVAVGVASFLGVANGATVAVCAIAVAGFVALVVADRATHVGHTVVSGLFGLGFASAGGVDLVTVSNDVERLNTVFKFWFQAWQVLGVASALAGWYVVARLVASARTRRSPQLMAGAAWGLGVASLVLVSLVYPVVAPGERLDQRFNEVAAGLDGFAFLDGDPTVQVDGVDVALADDLPLIEWLRTNVEGTPTIVEASGPIYSWTSRISIHTGLPTVIGWDWHQTQQRRAYAGEVADRKAEVEAFFRSTDDGEVARFLRRYDVAYVVVGTLEHRFGDPLAVAEFAEHPMLTEVFRDGDNAIYRVLDQ